MESSKQEMELSKQEMKLFLLYSYLKSKYFFDHRVQKQLLKQSSYFNHLSRILRNIVVSKMENLGLATF